MDVSRFYRKAVRTLTVASEGKSVLHKERKRRYEFLIPAQYYLSWVSLWRVYGYHELWSVIHDLHLSQSIEKSLTKSDYPIWV